MRLYLIYKAGSRAITIGLVPSLALAAAACGGGSAPAESMDDRIHVVTTIYPLTYFTERVGGPYVKVVSLIKAGVEAHAFEPTPGDLQTLARAELVILNGLTLERWVERALDALGAQGPATVVEASALAGATTSGSGIDPHVWLDPVLSASQVERIRDALVRLDPPHTDAYTANATSLLNELASLDASYRTGLADCHHDRFVTTHAAYGHLAERYGLEQLPIAGLTPEAEPTARELARLTTEIDGMGLRHLLAEPSLSSRIADTVAAESGLSIIPIHQMESVTANELAAHGDYLGLMRANLASLTEALGCAA